MNHLLTREQTAVHEFMVSSRPMYDIVIDDKGNFLFDVADGYLKAVAAFGLSELHHRQAERYEQVRPKQDPMINAYRKQGDLHNKSGLDSLAIAREALQQLEKNMAELPPKYSIEKDLDKFHEDLNSAISELEIKPSDVKKLDILFTQSFTEIKKTGTAGYLKYLRNNIDELSQLRKRKDRGAVDNIPIWKVAAIAVALGVFIWALFRCTWWGSCSLKAGAAAALAFNIAALIAKFC